MKGEQSGHVQKIVDLYLDCNNDTLLAVIEQAGGACDLGYHSCFDKRWKDDHFESLATKVFDPPSVYSYSKCLRIAIPTASLSACTVQLIKMALNPLTPEKDEVFRSTLPSCGVPIMFSSHDSRDIPALVASGVFDTGITGFDFIVEKQQLVVPIHLFSYNKRGRGPAIWAVAIPEAWATKRPHELEGKQIVTEVPNIIALFLRRNGIQANLTPRVGDHKQLRKQIGLSQQELAVRLGVALPTVNRWENRQSKPSPLALEKIEAFLHEVGEEGEVLIEKYMRKQMRSVE